MSDSYELSLQLQEVETGLEPQPPTVPYDLQEAILSIHVDHLKAPNDVVVTMKSGCFSKYLDAHQYATNSWQTQNVTLLPVEASCLLPDQFFCVYSR